MWSYYGSKSKIVDKYPAPMHDKIIEPFAGSARYALKYWDRQIVLVDKSEEIISIWHYIQQASVTDIKRLPILPAYSRIERKMFQCEGEFLLMKYLIVQGAFRGNYTVSKWGAMRFERNRKNIEENMHKIKHWQISRNTYQSIPNEYATWFIDPPYTIGGHKYPMSNKKIDYAHLSEWSKEREGQVIVCENGAADWLPFEPLVKFRGSATTKTEVIYTNIQNTLFTTQPQTP